MTLGAFSLTKLGQKLGQNPNSLLEAFCHNESWRRRGNTQTGAEQGFEEGF
nr:MAG TPA: hypothetical protein [Caudoviricetes sp.]